MSNKVFDLIIVGAGPCGLACGIEAQKKGLDYLILEKGSLTESIRKYPIQMTFFSTAENIEIGGIPFPSVGLKATRNEALQYYRKVSEYFQLKIYLYTAVTKIIKTEKYFEIHSSKQETFLANNVVIATGYFDFPKNLNISGESLPHVFKYYDEPYRFVHSKVILVGGGNSAVECALDLQAHHVEVTMVVRKEDFKPTAKYWLMPNLRNRIREGKIKALFNTTLKRIEKGRVWIEEEGMEEKMLPADFVLLLIGYTSDTQFLKSVGIQVTETDFVPQFNPETLESNIEGIYLAGTVVCGTHTERIFIENGRFDGEKIVKHILEKKATPQYLS